MNVPAPYLLNNLPKLFINNFQRIACEMLRKDVPIRRNVFFHLPASPPGRFLQGSQSSFVNWMKTVLFPAGLTDSYQTSSIVI